MNKRNIKIEVDTIQYGQPRPYADSTYKFILTVEGMSEWDVLQYCREILYPKKQTFKEWDEKKYESADVYFGGYYTFEKIDQNKYKYFVFEPFCD